MKPRDNNSNININKAALNNEEMLNLVRSRVPIFNANWLVPPPVNRDESISWDFRSISSNFSQPIMPSFTEPQYTEADFLSLLFSEPMETQSTSIPLPYDPELPQESGVSEFLQDNTGLSAMNNDYIQTSNDPVFPNVKKTHQKMLIDLTLEPINQAQWEKPKENITPTLQQIRPKINDKLQVYAIDKFLVQNGMHYSGESILIIYGSDKLILNFWFNIFKTTLRNHQVDFAKSSKLCTGSSCIVLTKQLLSEFTMRRSKYDYHLEMPTNESGERTFDFPQLTSELTGIFQKTFQPFTRKKSFYNCCSDIVTNIPGSVIKQRLPYEIMEALTSESTANLKWKQHTKYDLTEILPNNNFKNGKLIIVFMKDQKEAEKAYATMRTRRLVDNAEKIADPKQTKRFIKRFDKEDIISIIYAEEGLKDVKHERSINKYLYLNKSNTPQPLPDPAKEQLLKLLASSKENPQSTKSLYNIIESITDATNKLLTVTKKNTINEESTNTAEVNQLEKEIASPINRSKEELERPSVKDGKLEVDGEDNNETNELATNLEGLLNTAFSDDQETEAMFIEQAIRESMQFFEFKEEGGEENTLETKMETFEEEEPGSFTGDVSGKVLSQTPHSGYASWLSEEIISETKPVEIVEEPSNESTPGNYPKRKTKQTKAIVIEDNPLVQPEKRNIRSGLSAEESALEGSVELTGEEKKALDEEYAKGSARVITFEEQLKQNEENKLRYASKEEIKIREVLVHDDQGNKQIVETVLNPQDKELIGFAIDKDGVLIDEYTSFGIKDDKEDQPANLVTLRKSYLSAPSGIRLFALSGYKEIEVRQRKASEEYTKFFSEENIKSNLLDLQAINNIHKLECMPILREIEELEAKKKDLNSDAKKQYTKISNRILALKAPLNKIEKSKHEILFKIKQALPKEIFIKSFNLALDHLSNGNYEQALRNFLEAFKHFANDPNLKLVAAKYIEYTIHFAFKNKREDVINDSNQQRKYSFVDVKEFRKGFSEKNKWKDKGYRYISNAKREALAVSYVKSQGNEVDPSQYLLHSDFSSSTKWWKLQPNHKQYISRLEPDHAKAFIATQGAEWVPFKPSDNVSDPTTWQPIKNNPRELDATINARVMSEEMTDDQVSSYVEKSIELLNKYVGSPNLQQSEPVASQQSVSLSAHPSTLFKSPKKQKKDNDDTELFNAMTTSATNDGTEAMASFVKKKKRPRKEETSKNEVNKRRIISET